MNFLYLIDIYRKFSSPCFIPWRENKPNMFMLNYCQQFHLFHLSKINYFHLEEFLSVALRFHVVYCPSESFFSFNMLTILRKPVKKNKIKVIID